MIKVLIVEDDPMVAEFNKRYLQKIEGFSLIDTASTVKNAMEIINREQVDLILLDIYMPRENGLELLKKIIKLGKGIDVIVISAASDMRSVKTALRYGAVDYLIKPFEYERFQSALTSYREEVRFMEKQESISQEELDKYIFNKDSSATNDQITDLPKGLTKNTLKLILENIVELEGSPFSAEELASKVGISRVSMQKYIYFLTSLGLLTSEVSYGSVGRPVSRYQYVESKDYLIKQYK
ncbi:response regulator [Bacillus mesophilus]|uniref:Response regulator n=1 Tax=Bacillus mesophilus TaxID=1808955 RepID=A0A6M0Q523_9BACI|nr:response regulator [Bacillus mesophilus]NEY70899.1 response regulator [Bacillus mesophilus]